MLISNYPADFSIYTRVQGQQSQPQRARYVTSLHEGVFTKCNMATDKLHAEKRRNVLYVIAVWQEC